MARHIAQEWKPWLAYSNGKWPSGRIDWHGDMTVASSKSKSNYRWEQGAESAGYLIEQLSALGHLVVDPMMGVGTYGVAAIKLGRRFIGVEADSGRFNGAKELLSE